MQAYRYASSQPKSSSGSLLLGYRPWLKPGLGWCLGRGSISPNAPARFCWNNPCRTMMVISQILCSADPSTDLPEVPPLGFVHVCPSPPVLEQDLWDLLWFDIAWARFWSFLDPGSRLSSFPSVAYSDSPGLRHNGLSIEQVLSQDLVCENVHVHLSAQHVHATRTCSKSYPFSDANSWACLR